MSLTYDPALVDDALTCHRCGYDLREHVKAAVCPECAADVAASKQVHALPLRPDWADSDPAWRRRIVAGLWVLLLFAVAAVTV